MNKKNGLRFIAVSRMIFSSWHRGASVPLGHVAVDEKEGTMTQKKDDKRILQEFRRRQNRQFIAIALSLFSVLLCAVIYKRPDLFGAFSKVTLFGIQAVIIAGYIGFTSQNWRCPSCEKYMGTDINRQNCKKCGTRLR
jgi:hypothetical protein